MRAELRVPIGDDPENSIPVTLERIRRADWEWNDHNHADVLKLMVDWNDCPIDPRLVRTSTVQFYLCDAGGMGPWQPTRDNLRFVGTCTRAQRSRHHDSMVVELDFEDYTHLFLNCKPYPLKFAPLMSGTLRDAWQRICDTVQVVVQTDAVLSLRPNLTFEGGIEANIPVLHTAVAKRYQKLRGPMPIKAQTDAWAVWQQCVNMMGLISFIRKDHCIVTTATDLYTAGNAPVLVWGKNIEDLTETRHGKHAHKGIGLRSYNPASGTSIEALWPPEGDPRVLNTGFKKQKGAAKKPGTGLGRHGATPKPKVAKPPTVTKGDEDRAWYDYPEITDPDKLLDAAIRVYEERRRIELEGTLKTREMRVARQQDPSDDAFDLLNLNQGEVIEVRLELEVERAIRTGSDEYLRRTLQDAGYSPYGVELIVRNKAFLASIDPTFYTKAVKGQLEVQGGHGLFHIEIHYCNRIQIDGLMPAEDRPQYHLPADTTIKPDPPPKKQAPKKIIAV